MAYPHSIAETVADGTVHAVGLGFASRHAVPKCDLACVLVGRVDVPFRGDLDQPVITSSR
jgi:hypothetical protein